jgi:tetratricopeptide (TPR) repeat protein
MMREKITSGFQAKGIWIDIGLVLAILGGFFAIALVAANAFPVGNDDLFYTWLALRPQSGWFRYLHIYVLKLFITIWGPFTAGRWLWFVTAGISSVLVYVNARLFCASNTVLHGILALWLFCASQAVFLYAGSPLSDYTQLLWIMLLLFCYLLYHRIARYRWALVLAIGLLLVFAVDTKPTSIALVMVLPGLGLVAGKRFDWRVFARNMAWLMGGVLAGVLVLMGLDYIFLDDALVRFSSVARTVAFWYELVLHHPQTLTPAAIAPFQQMVGLPEEFPEVFGTDIFRLPSRYQIMHAVWYEALTVHGGILMLFLLWVVTGVKDSLRRWRLAEHILWLFPLALFLVLTVSTLYYTFSTERHFIPALAVMSILGAQFLPLEARTSSRRWWLVVGAMAILPLLLAVGMHVFVTRLARSQFLHEMYLYRGYIYPFGLFGVLAVFLFVRRWSAGWLFALFTSLFVVTVAPVWQIPQVMQEASDIAEERIAPFVAFEDYIVSTNDMVMFFSPGVQNFKYERSYVYSWMFEVVLDQQAKHGQFVNGGTIANLLERKASYLFFTQQEWYALDGKVQKQLQQQYVLQRDATRKLLVAARRDYLVQAAGQVLAQEEVSASQQYRAYVGRGTARMAAEEWQQAGDDFAQALQIDPQGVTALLGKGRALWQQGEFSAALDAFAQAEELAPHNRDVPFARGLLLAEAGEPQQAQEALDRALPLAEPYRYGLRSLEVYTQVTKTLPDYAPGFFFRGRVFEQHDNTERALQDYTQAISLTEEWFAPYASRGSLLFAQQQWARAVKDFDRALALQPATPVFYGCSEHQREFVSWYARVLKNEPVPSGTLQECLLLQRGQAYQQLGQQEKAQADLQRVIELSTDRQITEQAKALKR